MKKPRLGQNYLTDDSIAHKIVHHAGISNDQHVLEIGPGKGILTALLLEKAKSLKHIEVTTGGSASDGPGNYFQPTVIAGASQEDEITQKEVFGPVVSVTPFNEIEDAVN